ncbi:FKBP-type peptidyl-prolyl cis-trans isomerase [bacterium]|nr:FKBP-type peptidyl-prolyl cis-trans isomerase [bacterium]
MAAVLAGVLLVALTGCKGDSKSAEVAAIEIEPGLSYVDSLVGTGEAVKSGDIVQAHYTGWLQATDAKSKRPAKGTQFDSSLDRGEPIMFPVGNGSVIPGWEKGIMGMKVGGKRTLVIGPDLAFGAEGRPPVIPANSTLIFDITLVGLPKVEVQVQQEGTGAEAVPGDQIAVHYTGSLWTDGAVGQKFDSSLDRGEPYRFTLGAGMVIPGWDLGLRGLKVGTKARLIIPSTLGYGKQGTPGIPPNADLVFDVELVEIAGK